MKSRLSKHHRHDQTTQKNKSKVESLQILGEYADAVFNTASSRTQRSSVFKGRRSSLPYAGTSFKRC